MPIDASFFCQKSPLRIRTIIKVADGFRSPCDLHLELICRRGGLLKYVVRSIDMQNHKGNAALIALLAALYYLASASAVFATIHRIDVGNFSFTPAKTHVQPGDTVRWLWANGTHTSTTDPSSPKQWSSPVLSLTNQSFQVVFSAGDGPGPFPYHCIYHEVLYNMKDTIFMTASGVEVDPEGTLPGDFSVEQNYPNPFNPSTTIKFTLPRPSEVVLSVINVEGETVSQHPLGMLQAGSYSVQWDGRNSAGEMLQSGVYFYRVKAGEFVETRKMVLLK